jgi:hypothetical protein
MAAVSDPRHLTYALQQGRVLLTRNHVDFEDLHKLVLASGGGHSGILVVRFDNDPTRDMKPKAVVAAIGKLARSGLLLANQIHVLNHWR